MATTCVATFRTGTVTAVRHGPALACASVLKPIYAWVAGTPRWAALARAMITTSDNVATDQLVERAGGLSALRDAVAARTGVALADAATWGRIPVTAVQVAALYAALAVAAEAGDPKAGTVDDLMGQVRRPQLLRLDVRWASLTRQPHLQVGGKLGWDLDMDGRRLRTHAVISGPRHSAAVLTSVAVPAAVQVRWRRERARGGPDAVLALHAETAGRTLQEALSHAAETCR
jgi:hypothetical protein